MMQGLAIILSSPSGGGKSTIAKALIAMDSQLVISVSATTRNPRAGEVDGLHYFFRSRDEFVKMIDQGQLLEHSEIYGNLYGIPKEFIEEQFNKGNNIIFDINYEGAYKLKNILQDSVISIFILPPSIEELRKRLEARNQDVISEIDLRMNLAASEIEQAKNYDHIVVNNDFSTTVKTVHDLIKIQRKQRGL